MLPSWNDRLNIYLSNNLVVVSQKNGASTPSTIVKKSVQSNTAISTLNNWQAVLMVLAEVLKTFPKAQEVNIYIASQFVRYLLINPQDNLITLEEEEAYVRFCFNEVYGKDANAWTLRWAGGLAVDHQVASAIDTQFLEALTQLLATSKKKINTLQPYLMRAANLIRREVNTTKQWIVLAEFDRVNIGFIVDGEWTILHSSRLSSAWADDLKDVVAREIQCYADDDSKADILLCLPELTHRKVIEHPGLSVKTLVITPEALLDAKFIPVGVSGAQYANA